MDEVFEVLWSAIEHDDPIVSATLIRGVPLGAKLLLTSNGLRQGTLGTPSLDELVAMDAVELLSAGKTETRTYRLADDTDVDVYIESFTPPRRLVVVGAVHTAIPLVAFARELGYHTTVIDARGFFATRERFPHADELIEAWPDEALTKLPLGPQTDIVLLAHDPKFEDPAMNVALKSRAGYIGAMGSRKTSRERSQRLIDAGFSESDVARIHGPIGLDIGARSPAEIAISILAEIIAERSAVTSTRSDGGRAGAREIPAREIS
ncbi:MAG: XdhC family protein [Thermomicrobiales bacterium]|nr:XdhC family protein [Thermomicrobiales bacterium]